MGKNQNPQFAMLPFKLARLGLSPFEIATFFVLRMYADKDGKGARPSWEVMCKDSGIRRSQLHLSLRVLKECSIRTWESGWKGHPNRYEFLPIGRWSPRIQSTIRTIKVDKNKADIVHHMDYPVHHMDKYSPPYGPDLDPVLDPLSRLGEISANAFELPREQTEADLRERRRMLLNQARQLAKGE